MQNAPINKTLMTWLIVAVALAVIYFGWTLFLGGGGGFGTGDIPEPTGLRPSPAPETAAPPAEEAPPPSPPVQGGPAAPAVGGAPSPAPQQGQGPVAGGSPAPGAPSPGAPAPPAGPETGAPAEAAAPARELSEEEEMEGLAAFEKIDSREIIQARLKEAESDLTVVDADAGLPYPDTGRSDPLTIISSAIPEELRPPRTGETDYDEILDFLITFYGTSLLESVEIEVWSVMQMGLVRMVNLSVDGMLATIPEGRSVTLPSGVVLTVNSASQDEVSITLSFDAGYTSVSKTKTFIPKD